MWFRIYLCGICYDDFYVCVFLSLLRTFVCFYSLSLLVKNPSLYQRTNRELGAGVEAAHAAAMGGPAIKNGGGGGVYPASSGAHEEHYAEGTKRERERRETRETRETRDTREMREKREKRER